ncbi:MAG: hypothetical protein AAGA80_01870 [Cyanobacteria bacterium P01_F01_bin.143]
MSKYKKPMTLEEIAQVEDSDIDFSDIPELDVDFWNNAEIVQPETTQHVSLRLKKSVSKYFQTSGQGYRYQARINLFLSGFPMVIGGAATIISSSELGEIINSFFERYGFQEFSGFSLTSSICADSMFLVGFTITLLGLSLIFLGLFGYIFGFIFLDDEILESFRKRAETEGLSYQTLINRDLKANLQEPISKPLTENDLRRILREELLNQKISSS